MKPTFFKSQSEFRGWLEANHEKAAALLLGFHKKQSGKSSITYREALDLALAFGWIDGVRKNVDEDSYTIRFTPRRANSIWSLVNIKRVGELTNLGLMTPPGIAAFEKRDADQTARRYSYEVRSRELAPAYLRKMKANRKAWEFFEGQPPWYRRTASHWVMSAKKEETRVHRLDALIAGFEKGKRV